MIYELRTYTLKPGSVPEFEERFTKRQPFREKHSKLGGFWHTEFGPLNEVVHIWPYESLQHRQDVRDAMAKDSDLQKMGGSDLIVSQDSEIYLPAPFMRPLGGDQALGSIYEMRSYTFLPGAMNGLIESWTKAIPQREEYSPMAAGMFTELGGLNKWVHIWPYKSVGDRDRIRAETVKAGIWPPGGEYRNLMVKQETKIMAPAAFSPLH